MDSGTVIAARAGILLLSSIGLLQVAVANNINVCAACAHATFNRP